MAPHRRSPPTPPKSSIPPTPPRAGFGLPKGDFFTAPKGFSRPSLCPKGEVTAPQGWVRGHFGRCGDLREEAAPKGLCRRERCPGCNAVPALSLLAAPQRRDSPLHPTAHPLLSEGDRGAEKLSSRFFFALIFSFLFLHFFLSLLDFRFPISFSFPPPSPFSFPLPSCFFPFSPFHSVFSFPSPPFLLYSLFSPFYPFPFTFSSPFLFLFLSPPFLDILPPLKNHSPTPAELTMRSTPRTRGGPGQSGVVRCAPTTTNRQLSPAAR